MSDKILKKYKDVVCHDCGRVLEDGDEVMPYYTKDGDFFKCKECHQKNKTLTNYKPIEVYSRVVGYIRPVSQWNPGKQTEYKDRINYKIDKL
jgi:anaerobic ribonucleoside-triphosphate reductase